MLVLPTWVRVVSAYSVAAIVPMLLPTAHGDDCRVATMIAATCLAGTRVPVTAAINVSIVLWLCPARALWWPTTDEPDNVNRVLKEILEWMDTHDDVPPKVQTKPAPDTHDDVKKTVLANA